MNTNILKIVASFALLVAYPDVSLANEAIEKFAAAVKSSTYSVRAEGEHFTGDGWELLKKEAGSAQFLLLGEEHGIAENPVLATALFKALIPSGYKHFAIEISPIMASQLDHSSKSGIEGIKGLLSNPHSNVAFFGMSQEAKMVADVRALIPEERNVFWGLDYEVMADRFLIQKLSEFEMTDQTRAVFSSLKESSDTNWQRYDETRNPQYVFSFSGEPALVSNLIQAWPTAPEEAISIMDTLHNTLLINKHWVSGDGYQSNLSRANHIKKNFLKYWKKYGSSKVFFKFGASHMIRGLNSNNVYDLGSLLPEVAAAEGGHAFQLLVLPGKDSKVARFNPTNFSYESGSAKDGYARGLELITTHVLASGYSLFDIRPLRKYAQNNNGFPDELKKVLFGFDAILIMTDSTASSNLL